MLVTEMNLLNHFPLPLPPIPAFFFAFWQQEPTNYWAQIYESQ